MDRDWAVEQAEEYKKIIEIFDTTQNGSTSPATSAIVNYYTLHL